MLYKLGDVGIFGTLQMCKWRFFLSPLQLTSYRSYLDSKEIRETETSRFLANGGCLISAPPSFRECTAITEGLFKDRN